MKPKIFDRHVPLRIDKTTYNILRRMQAGRRATIAALIRKSIDEAINQQNVFDEVVEIAQDIDPTYKFNTMFLISSTVYENVISLSEETGLSRNTFLVACIRRFTNAYRGQTVTA